MTVGGGEGACWVASTDVARCGRAAGRHRHARSAGLFGELVHAREDTHVVIIAAHPYPGCAAHECSHCSAGGLPPLCSGARPISGAYMSGLQHGTQGGIAAKRSLRSRRPSTHPSAQVLA